MLERIAEMCRVVACESRLVILYQLCLEPELPASEIAKRSQIERDVASMHFKRLIALRFLSPRRSGSYVYYRLWPERAQPSEVGLLPLIRLAISDCNWATRGWREKAILHLDDKRVHSLPAGVRRVLDVIFDATTAFSNVRRLQIVRFLLDKGMCSPGEIRRELSMSANAASRHLAKLERRGYLRREGVGGWALDRTGRTPFHAKLLAMVLSHCG